MRYLIRRVIALLGFSEEVPDISYGHLTVVLLIRVLILLGASARLGIHLKQYLERGVLGAELATLGLFALYIGVLLLLRQRKRELFASERFQLVQLVTDVAFISVLYFLTGNLESDFFMFFVIPLLLPTTMNWRLKSALAPALSALSLFTLVTVMPHVWGYPGEPSTWMRDQLRVFMPRMVFLGGVALLVNLILEYRRDAVAEARERRDLQGLLEKMSRQSALAAAAALPGNGSGNGAATGANGKQPGFFQIGQNLNRRYKLLSTLGRGGMGEVFQALDLELDDVVALKILAPMVMPDGTEGIVTLKKEIRLQRRITHPNVVRVHDLGDASGLQFLTMEYVPGTTLRSLVKREGALPIGPALQIFKQLCSGLEAIHSEGIVHRDIKPENVMVLPNGNVKLMDFGVAQLVLDLDAGAERGVVAGSPYYMSPEQLQQQRVDRRSDLYSLGVIMFEVFTGRHPFGSRSLREVIRDQVLTHPPRAAEVRSDVPEPLDRVIDACLRKEPGERPDSAEAIYAALLGVPA